MKILVLGGCSWDTLIHVGEIHSLEDDMSLWADNVVETVGGTGAGKALCLDALGHDVTLVTKIGEDELGNKIKSYFDETGIKVINLSSKKSTAHTNLMHSKGKRITVFTSNVTMETKILPNISTLVEENDLVFLNINEFCREYIPYIVNKGKKIVVDIHDYNPPNPYHDDFIEVADIITASGVYIPNHNDFMDQMIKRGKEIVVITSGSEGLVAKDHKENTFKLQGYNDFKYVDSNGAGDSFCSGFATKYYETKNVGESLKYGTICGGVACTTYDLFNKEYDDIKIKNIKKRVDF